MFDNSPFNPDEPEIDEFLADNFEDFEDFEGCDEFQRIPSEFCEHLVETEEMEDDFPY